MNDEQRWEDFQSLVTWATWEVIESLTKGEPLRSVIFRILNAARVAEFKK